MALHNSSEAERATKKWLRERYGDKLRDLIFTRVWKEGEFWTVDVQAKMAKGLLGTEVKEYSLQVEVNSGDVLGYK